MSRGKQVASLFALLDLDDSKFQAKLKDAKGALQDTAGRLDAFGSTLQGLGAQMTMFTAPLALGLGDSVRAFVSFEESVINATSLLGLMGEDVTQVSDKLRDMSSGSIQGPQEVADAFYGVVSATGDLEKSYSILASAQNLASAGNVALADATEGLTSVMLAYDLQIDDAARVSDVFATTVKMGVATLDQFAGALGPASGLAYDLGISFEELAASTAFLTQTGSSASEAVTQLEAIMSAFLKPSSAMKDALAEMGVESGNAAIQQYGLIGSVQELSEALGGDTGAIAEALGTKEALEGVVGLLGDRAIPFLSKFSEELGGATDRLHGLQTESAAYQLKMLSTEFAGLRLEVGQAFLPAVRDGVQTLSAIVGVVLDFAQANPALFSTLVQLTGVLVVLGPVLGVAGTAFRAAGMAITAVQVAMKGAAAAAAMIPGAVGAAAAASQAASSVMAGVWGNMGKLAGMAFRAGLLAIVVIAVSEAIQQIMRTRAMLDQMAQQMNAALRRRQSGNNPLSEAQFNQMAWNASMSQFEGAGVFQDFLARLGFAAVSSRTDYDQFATGSVYVPQTQLAMVHRGERIIPAAQNRGGMGAQSGIRIDNFNYQATEVDDSLRNAADLIERLDYMVRQR